MSNSVRPFDSINIGPRLIYLYLTDGRTYHVPRRYTVKLAEATTKQLRNYRFIGSPPQGVHWPDIDEDIFIGLLGEFLRV